MPEKTITRYITAPSWSTLGVAESVVIRELWVTLSLERDCVFDTNDGGDAQELAILFGHHNVRCIIRLHLDEIGPHRFQLVIQEEVQGFARAPRSVIGPLGARREIFDGPTILFASTYTADTNLEILFSS